MSRLRLLNSGRQPHLLPSCNLAIRSKYPRSQPQHFTKSRHFTQRLSLLLISQASTRPQLPFLTSKLTRISSPATRTNRYLSDDRKARIKALIRWNVRLQVYVWTAFLLGLISYNGLEQIKFEHKYPTPREWGFWSRWYLRNGKIKEYEDKAKVNGVAIDWQKVGVSYRDLLKNLEDEKKEGTNLVRRNWDGASGIDGGGEILVDDLAAIGFDITAKVEPWRRGYYEGLMGAARAAEHLDGMAKPKGKDLIRSFIIPWTSVLGPNNPRPKKLPWDKAGEYEKVHRYEDMENAYEAPEYYYMRILTTHEFTTKQRLDAALAYADWLGYKGQDSIVSSVYEWAVDIAASGIPVGAGHVVDMETGIINQGHDDFVTSNLLTATTAMGVHLAKTGEVKQALPIFLSVLRARRNAPPSEAISHQPLQASEEKGGWMSYLTAVKDLVIDQPYPKAPSDGNERPEHTMKEACEEIGLMTYIGEILFATSDKEQEKGLSWTRDSVGAAEAVLWLMDEMNEGEEPAKTKCQECLETGLENWKKMAHQMALLAKKEETRVQNGSGWLGLGIGKGSALQRAQGNTARWQAEESQISLMKEKTASLLAPSTLG